MEEGGKWVPFGSTTHTHSNRGKGGFRLGSPIKKHVMILVVTGNLGWGLDPRYHHVPLGFPSGAPLDTQDITVNCIAPAVVQTASQLPSQMLRVCGQ